MPMWSYWHGTYIDRMSTEPPQLGMIPLWLGLDPG